LSRDFGRIPEKKISQVDQGGAAEQGARVEIPVLGRGVLPFHPSGMGGVNFSVCGAYRLCDYQAKLTIYTGVLIAIATRSCETVKVPFAHLPIAVKWCQSLLQAEPTQAM
jgi:hypothetical protein